MVVKTSYSLPRYHYIRGSIHWKILAHEEGDPICLGEEVKRCFWEDLDEVVHGIPQTENIFIGGDFNGHVGGGCYGL